MILLRILKVVDFQCDEREERFASAMLGPNITTQTVGRASGALPPKLD